MNSRFDLKHIRIKPATPRDTTSLLHLIRAYYRFDQIPFDHKAIAYGLSLLLNEPALGRVWLILKGGKAVGYLILTFGFDLEFGGRQATLTDLYIKAPHRRMGIGRAVVEHVEDFCRSSEVMVVELQVTNRNSGVLDFYRRVGFQAHDRIPMSKRVGR
jgi:ribosomal protein S18 acetylase RimI-like enzyme